MKKTLLWTSLALTLFVALIHTRRPGGPHQMVLGTWYTHDSVDHFTFKTGPGFQDDSQGILVRPWFKVARGSNWGGNYVQALNYKFIDDSHIELSDWRGPTGERWTIRFGDGNTLRVRGAWGIPDGVCYPNKTYYLPDGTAYTGKLELLKIYGRRLLGK